MIRFKTPTALAAGAVAATLALAALSPAPIAKDVPFVPTPQAVVDTMLDMAEVTPDDILYDLGSGDGRIVITAAKRGVKKAVGVDIDPERVADGWRNAQQARVTDRVSFVEGNVFTFDFSEATVLTMYLLPSVNLKLRPRVLSELKPGTRVVSHQFDMGDWRPDEQRQVGSAEVYFWIVPAKVEGTWTWAEGGQNYRLDLKQKYQQVEGTLTASGEAIPITAAKLEGERLRFEARGPDGTLRFEGRVSGDRMTAKVNDRTVTAERTS